MGDPISALLRSSWKRTGFKLDTDESRPARRSQVCGHLLSLIAEIRCAEMCPPFSWDEYLASVGLFCQAMHNVYTSH